MSDAFGESITSEMPQNVENQAMVSGLDYLGLMQLVEIETCCLLDVTPASLWSPLGAVASIAGTT